MAALTRPRNDVRQYDELAAEWWARRGVRDAALAGQGSAALIPPPGGPGRSWWTRVRRPPVAPHVAGKGYRHVGVDRSRRRWAGGPQGVRGAGRTRTRLPLPDRCADVVSAGEILEHVTGLSTAVAEACRVLRPGGMLVLDTLAETRAARWSR